MRAFRKGDEVTIHFSSPNFPHGYAMCTYSHQMDGKHYFTSNTYDWEYIVDPVSNTVVNTYNPGKVYQINNSTGWADRLLAAVAQHEPLDKVIAESASETHVPSAGRIAPELDKSVERGLL